MRAWWVHAALSLGGQRLERSWDSQLKEAGGTCPLLPCPLGLVHRQASPPGAEAQGAASTCSPRKGTPACLASSSPPPLEKMLVHS